MIEDTGTKLTVYLCDTRVHRKMEFDRESVPVKFEAIGRGGTDFRPVFKTIEDEEEKPAGLVFFTDMEGQFPGKEPDYPVLWTVVNGTRCEAPFGRVVRMQEE